MNWYLAVLKNYAKFSGRARRKEYWMFMVFYGIFGAIAIILDNIFGIAFIGYGPISLLYMLAMCIPSLAVGVRRLHDVGKSGWMFLVAIIPIIGAFWLLFLTVTDSNPGQNKFGPNPKEATA